MIPQEIPGQNVGTLLLHQSDGSYTWQLVLTDGNGRLVSVLAEGRARTLAECLRPAEDLRRELAEEEARTQADVAGRVSPATSANHPRSEHVQPPRIDPKQAGHPADVWREGGGG